MKNRNQEEQVMGENEGRGPPERSPLKLAAEVEDLINTGRAQIKDDTLILPVEVKGLYDEIQSLKDSKGIGSLVDTLANHNPDFRFSEVILETLHTTDATFHEIYERGDELKARAGVTKKMQTGIFTVKGAMAVDKQREMSKKGDPILHAQFADNTATFPTEINYDTFTRLKTLVKSNLSAKMPDPAYGTPYLYDLTIEVNAIPVFSEAKKDQLKAVKKEIKLLKVENERVGPCEPPTEQALKVLREKPYLVGLVGLEGLSSAVMFERTQQANEFLKLLIPGTVTHTSNGLFFGKYPAGASGTPQWRIGLAYVHPKVYVSPGGIGLALENILIWATTRTYSCSRGTMTAFGALIPFLMSYETFERNRQKYTAVDRSTPVTLVLKGDAIRDILSPLIESPPLREEDLDALGLDRNTLLRVFAVTNNPKSQRVIREVAEHFGHNIRDIVSVLPTKIFKGDDHGVFVEDRQVMFAYIKLLRAVLDKGGDSDLGEFALRMVGTEAHDILGGEYRRILEKLEKEYGLVHRQGQRDNEYIFEIPRECRDAARTLQECTVSDDGVTSSEELRKEGPTDAECGGEVDS